MVVDFNNYQKTEKKRKRDTEALKKYYKMLFSMAKRSVSLSELNNIKKIKAKASKKHCYFRRDSSSSDSD